MACNWACICFGHCGLINSLEIRVLYIHKIMIYSSDNTVGFNVT